MIIICVIGKTCAGKRTFVDLINKYYVEQNLISEPFLVQVIQDNIFIEYLETFSTSQKVGQQQQSIDSQEPSSKSSQPDLKQLEKLVESKKQCTQQYYDKLTTDLFQQWNKNTLIYQVYNINIIKQMRNRNYFHVIYLDSSSLMRYQRAQKKYKDLFARLPFEMTFERFNSIDDMIYYNTDLGDCICQANLRIINNYGTVVDFSKELIEQKPKILRDFRPSWDQYFMKVAFALKSRSNCMKKSVGAVLVKNNRIISTGYNGTPSGIDNCYQGGCKTCNESKTMDWELEKCMCIHAEEAALLEAGTQLTKNSTLYTSSFPCTWCAKCILQSKVTRLVYSDESNYQLSYNMLKDNLQIEKLQLEQFLYQI